MSDRLTSVDATRAVVMIVMTLDHASSAFNAGRLSGDGAGMSRPETIDAMQFATRWLTHMCAPAFFLLAGISIALVAARRTRSDASLDRDLLVRGALLVVLEVVWMSWAWRFELTRVHLEVLYALGCSMILMVVVRRLPVLLLLALSLALLLGCELVADQLSPILGRDHPALAALVTGARYDHVTVLYPVLPWLGFMTLGYVIGLRISAGAFTSAKPWLALAAMATLAFLVVRGVDAYGNFDLFRDGDSLIAWLRTSKYPPSLAFAASELALVFVLLATWTRLPAPAPLLVLGRTSLLFYLLHIHLLKAVAFALGVHRSCGLGVTYLAWALALVTLYPVCLGYDRIKQRHPRSVLRFL